MKYLNTNGASFEKRFLVVLSPVINKHVLKARYRYNVVIRRDVVAF